jgi:hypothetical protein
VSTAYRYGLLALKPPRVTLRPINNIAIDLRDHHLRARWNRLVRRWRKP